MTGADHYREAERLLGDHHGNPGYIATPPPEIIAAAQVHATLALAAATYDYDWNQADEAAR